MLDILLPLIHLLDKEHPLKTLNKKTQIPLLSRLFFTD